jgi:hypothetical protein
VDVPVDPLFTHPASPFMRTEPPQPVAFAAPPTTRFAAIMPAASWTAHKTQIQFGFAILAYLMVLVGAVTAVSANPEAGWRVWVALLPALPGGLVVWLTARQLGRLDEVQKRTQMQAMGFAVAATALVTFGYGLLETAGFASMNATLVLPLMAFFWGVGLLIIVLRQRFRR